MEKRDEKKPEFPTQLEWCQKNCEQLHSLLNDITDGLGQINNFKYLEMPDKEPAPPKDLTVIGLLRDHNNALCDAIYKAENILYNLKELV